MSEKIRYVECMFTDLFGRLKSMVIPCRPVDSIDELRKDPALKQGASVDGSSVTGLANVEASDLRLEPDVSSLIELPYTSQRTAGVMCSIRKKVIPGQDSLYPLDARSVFLSVYEKCLGTRQLKVKIEPEFHFITMEGELFDYGEYADTYPQNPGADTLLRIASTIQDAGMGVKVAHHEHGHSQVEIEIDFEDARKAADNIVLFKNIARAIAREDGFDVTFMPKPFEGAAGNGLHCHLQLWDGDKNLFGHGGSELSETAMMFVAGLIQHAPAITAFANPTVNSYKRLVPHHEAPVYVCWGPTNRTVLIRVPLFVDSQKAAVELRSPDPACNPYLLFAAIIAAGMDGISRKMKPPEPCTRDVFAMSDEQRESLGITTLPSNLGAALDALEHDSVLIEALGQQLVRKYVSLKRREWSDYCNHVVTEWEWDTYSGT
ncbi:MAG: glutamine synthetase [Candidatus Thorarchaeota archaeon]|nr:glutamine synthetase [Candidatus Thorarchaeota archaeon]